MLSIVRGHGGFIRVKSEICRGTTFELWFPVSNEAEIAAPIQEVSELPKGAGELVLIVDDELAIREAIQYALIQRGFEAITAESGREALQRYNDNRQAVRAVITDIMMPDIDGKALGQVLRDLESNLPLICMTGLTDPELEDGNSHCFDAVLRKPFPPHAVVKHVHAAVQGTRPR